MKKLSENGLSEIKKLIIDKHTTNRHNSILLLDHIDAIEAEKDKLIDSVAQMKKEYDELMNDHISSVKSADKWYEESMQLTEQLDAKKVVLPKEVANEIEYFKFNYASNVWEFELLHSIFKSTTNTKYIRGVVFDISLQALVNGFTVEEEPTTEDKLKQAFSDAYDVWLKAPVSYGACDDNKNELIGKLIAASRQIINEDAVKQHEAE